MERALRDAFHACGCDCIYCENTPGASIELDALVRGRGSPTYGLSKASTFIQ